MNNVFTGIEINKELPEAEIEAINSLKNVDANNLKAALKNENIPWTNQTFIEMAEAFSTYGVDYQGEKLIYNESAPDRLKNMIDNDGDDDLAYLIYMLLEFFNIDKGQIESKKITKNTERHLASLKAAIETEAVKTEVTETIEKVSEITVDDITISNLKNWVTKEAILAAVQTLGLTNPQLANEIIPLLKKDEVKEIQLKLWMGEGRVSLYKRADGLFGTTTLTNLEAGKVVAPSSSVKSTEKATNTILVTQEQINTAVATITDTTKKTAVEWFIKEKNIKGLQEYIFNKTDWAHPKNSKRWSERDGVLGKNTLDGIKALNTSTPSSVPNKKNTAEKIKELTELGKKIQERKEVYKTDKVGAIKWLQNDLLVTERFGDDMLFLLTFAESLLKDDASFVYDNDTWYIIIGEWGDPTLTEDKNKYEKAKKEKELTERNQKRQKQANKYADKIFSETIKINNVWWKKFVIKNEINTSLKSTGNLPSIVSELEFETKEKAESFIKISKEYIKTYGYASLKNSPQYNEKKLEYIKKVQDLTLNFKEKTVVDTFTLNMKLSSAIDSLECRTVLPGAGAKKVLWGS